MRTGYLLDAGVLQGLVKEKSPHTPLRDRLTRRPFKLVTIRDVVAECLNVPFSLLDELGIGIEPTQKPFGSPTLLDAFSAAPRKVWWRIDEFRRADRALIGHAIAKKYDVLTTDRRMKQKSFQEFLKRLQRLSDKKLPAWYIPEIVIVERGLWH